MPIEALTCLLLENIVLKDSLPYSQQGYYRAIMLLSSECQMILNIDISNKINQYVDFT